MDRRHFCIASAAAAVWLGADRACAVEAALPGPPVIELDKVLYDSRYPGSGAFGAAAVRACLPAFAFPGDVTTLWRQILRPSWAAGGGSIAGMTTAAGLFCLEQLAKDHWMRVVLRIEHWRPLSGMIAHRVTAAEPTLNRVCSALSGAPDWPARSFALLSGCPRAKNQARVTRVVSGADRERYPSADAELVSWIIAA
jgi:hypothetical protein